MADDDDNLRADARANRDRILEVAREALAADPAASLNSIAKTAGVGPGTLYRHFPNREALVLGIYRNAIEALVGLAPELLAKHAPLPAFQLWCERLAQFGRVKHGVAEVLRAARTDEDSQATYWPMVGAVRQLMEACVSAGDIRPDTTPEDFLLLLTFLWKVPPSPAGEAQTKRVLALIFRGLGATVR